MSTAMKREACVVFPSLLTCPRYLLCVRTLRLCLLYLLFVFGFLCVTFSGLIVRICQVTGYKGPSIETSSEWGGLQKTRLKIVFYLLLIVSPVPTLHTYTQYTLSVLMAIFPGEPGLAVCSLNSLSPFIPELRILLGQA